MPIELHDGCVKQLIKLVEQALVETTCSYNAIIDYPQPEVWSALDKVLPADKSRQLEGYINHAPVATFLKSVFQRDLNDWAKYDGDARNVPLTSLYGGDVSELAVSYVTELRAMPVRCVFTYTLPKSIAQYLDPKEVINISDGVVVTFGTDDVVKTFPMDAVGGSALSSLLGFSSRMDSETCYLQIFIDGFVDRYTPTAASMGASALCRSILGLGSAHRAWRVGPEWMGEKFSSPGFVHALSGNEWKYVSQVSLDRTVARAIERLQFDFLDGHIANADQARSWLATNLKAIALILRTKKNELILRGSQWYFDSFASENVLDAYIRATVAVEIMLGEEDGQDGIGLTTMLANRCAYLISNNHDERENFLDDFREIYKLRSKIVHTGFDRLMQREQDMLYKLQWICLRIIQKESKLLVS